MIDYSKYPWSSYGAMVRMLNKPMGSFAADLLHSAVGLSGEVAELLESESRKNTIEECGDLEFYLEAGWQTLEASAGKLFQRRRIDGIRGCWLTHVLLDMVASAGTLLDRAKKVWVYNKPISHADFASAFEMFEINLGDFYRIHDLKQEHILEANMDKLAIRYRGGYSDTAAQARADKEA